jgi:hypothetical protein
MAALDNRFFTEPPQGKLKLLVIEIIFVSRLLFADVVYSPDDGPTVANTFSM